MANTTYKELADAVFNKIKDVDFASIDEEIAYQIVIGYMRPAIVSYQSAKQDLSDRDDELEQFNFVLKTRLSSSDFHSLNLHNQLGKALELRSILKPENDQLAINKSYKDSKLFDLVTNRKKV